MALPRIPYILGPRGDQVFIDDAYIDATKRTNAFATFGMSGSNLLGACQSLHDLFLGKMKSQASYRSNGTPFRTTASTAASWIGFAGNGFSLVSTALAYTFARRNEATNYQKNLNDAVSVMGPAFAAMALAQSIYGVGQIDKQDQEALDLARLAVVGATLNGVSAIVAGANCFVRERDGLYHLLNAVSLIVGHAGALSSNLAGVLLLQKDCGGGEGGACAVDVLSTVGHAVSVCSGFLAWGLGMSAGLRLRDGRR